MFLRSLVGDTLLLCDVLLSEALMIKVIAEGKKEKADGGGNDQGHSKKILEEGKMCCKCFDCTISSKILSHPVNPSLLPPP